MSERSPVFIIGAARSGTKFLRDVLAASPEVACVPYDINYVWRYKNENYSHDALAVDSVTEKVTASIRRNISSLSGVKINQILVEKTVSNSLRVPFVATVCPNAHFVHLVRDGRAVTESAMRQWKKKPDISSLVTKLRQMPLGSFNYVSWFTKNFVTGLFKGRGGGAYALAN